jgi:hypothetical protein
MKTFIFKGVHTKVTALMNDAGFIFGKDFSYSGTLGDSLEGKKGINYITFYNDDAKNYYNNNIDKK